MSNCSILWNKKYSWFCREYFFIADMESKLDISHVLCYHERMESKLYIGGMA